MTPRRAEWVSVLVRPPHNPWRMFEEVPSRALFPRAGVAGPTRRGPHAGPRRAPSSGSRESSSQPVRLAVGASIASQAQRILPTAGHAGGGKAGYKTATNKVCRGRSGRAHARRTSESKPRSGLRTGSKQARAGAPVLTSISPTPQTSVSRPCLSEGRRGSAGVRVSVGQHKLGSGRGGTDEGTSQAGSWAPFCLEPCDVHDGDVEHGVRKRGGMSRPATSTSCSTATGAMPVAVSCCPSSGKPCPNLYQEDVR
jgi:hypothetical protein